MESGYSDSLARWQPPIVDGPSKINPTAFRVFHPMYSPAAQGLPAGLENEHGSRIREYDQMQQSAGRSRQIPVGLRLDPVAVAEHRAAMRARANESRRWKTVDRPMVFTLETINVCSADGSGVPIMKALAGWDHTVEIVPSGAELVVNRFGTLLLELWTSWPAYGDLQERYRTEDAPQTTVNRLVYITCFFIARWLQAQVGCHVRDVRTAMWEIGSRPKITLDDIYLTQVSVARHSDMTYIIPTMRVKNRLHHAPHRDRDP